MGLNALVEPFVRRKLGGAVVAVGLSRLGIRPAAAEQSREDSRRLSCKTATIYTHGQYNGAGPAIPERVKTTRFTYSTPIRRFCSCSICVSSSRFAEWWPASGTPNSPGASYASPTLPRNPFWATVFCRSGYLRKRDTG